MGRFQSSLNRRKLWSQTGHQTSTPALPRASGNGGEGPLRHDAQDRAQTGSMPFSHHRLRCGAATLLHVVNWSNGSYEHTAAALAPAAEVAVAVLEPREGERVLDVACGTGNAAALVAEAGSEVTGIDSAERLIHVARNRIPGANFVVGDAERLPFADKTFAAAVSVFGVIFASTRAADELRRVVEPGGRIVITAWLPEGPLFQAAQLVRRLISAPPDVIVPTAWHEVDTLERLFDRPLHLERHDLTFTGSSAETWWDEQVERHPLWIAAGAGIDSLRDQAVEVLRAGSSSTEVLRVTSPYVVARVDV